MHEISISDKSTCNLNCVNCPKHIYGEIDIISFDNFKLLVKRAIKLNFHQIGLTPFYGEPFLIPNYLQKLNYLESLKEITDVSSATNLICIEDLEILCNFSKLELSISFYGKNEASYFKRTGKNYFKKFIKNLKKLNKYCKTNKYTTKFIVQNRIIDSTGSEDILNLIPDLIFEIDNRGIIDKEYNNNNEYNHIGICDKLFKDNIIMPDNHLYYCCWYPYINEFDGGDFLTNDNHSKLINLIINQKNGIYNEYCKTCNWFVNTDEDDFSPNLIGKTVCKIL